MTDILELRYSATNTYLIRGRRGSLLLDTGWAGTFPLFCRALGEAHARLQEISYILITHFHPDHMGIAQEIASCGPRIAVPSLQLPYLHAADGILSRDSGNRFLPIKEEALRVIAPGGSRAFLKELGLDGEILATPGHSEDSISLWLDEGIAFVGDLNPLYELELHRGTRIWESWQMLLSRKPGRIYYGHAKTAEPGSLKEAKAANTADTANAADAENAAKAAKAANAANSANAAKAANAVNTAKAADAEKAANAVNAANAAKAVNAANAAKAVNAGRDFGALVRKIMKYTEKGVTLDGICRKTGAERSFAEDVVRIYLTHPGVTLQGILDRLEIKGK